VIFISDLPDVVMPGNTIALYADDCKTSGVVSYPSDQQDFQCDLDNLCEWSQRNLMDFNVKKCKLLHITKKKMPLHADLKLNGCSLEETYEFCSKHQQTGKDTAKSFHVYSQN